MQCQALENNTAQYSHLETTNICHANTGKLLVPTKQFSFYVVTTRMDASVALSVTLLAHLLGPISLFLSGDRLDNPVISPPMGLWDSFCPLKHVMGLGRGQLYTETQ